MAEVVWKPVSIRCISCAEKLTGYKNAEGKVKFVCPRCKMVMVSQLSGKKGKLMFIIP